MLHIAAPVFCPPNPRATPYRSNFRDFSSGPIFQSVSNMNILAAKCHRRPIFVEARPKEKCLRIPTLLLRPLGMVRRPYQRPALHMPEALGQRDLLIFCKLRGRDIRLHGQMGGGGLEVLP